jgi:hypothetical protein
MFMINSFTKLKARTGMANYTRSAIYRFSWYSNATYTCLLILPIYCRKNNMRLLILALLSLSFLFSMAQQELKPEELKDHIGDSVKVKGKIFGVRYFESAKNSPTLINVGGAYPNQVYTIVIFGEVRKKLGFAPEESKYTGGMAIVTGKVELYKDKPQIVITDPAQLQILFDEEVPAGKLPTIKQN